MAHSRGRVAASGRIKGETLSFTWRERGGHPAKVLSRRGFSIRLLEKAVDRGGTARLEGPADGVVWQAAAPVNESAPV